jgi:outer membrane protein insertion porin family
MVDPGGTISRGTLVFEARDAGEDRLIFYGVAHDTIEGQPQEDLERIEKAVWKLVRELRKNIRRFEPDLHPFEGRAVAAINVVGFKKTREYVIRREIRSRVGLELSVVEDDVVRLRNLSLFSQVRVDAEKGDDGIHLEFQLKESPPVIPYPAVAFTEENGFSIGLGLSASNVTGRDISASGRALFGGTNNYNLLAKWPWVTGNHVELGFMAAHVERADEVRGFNETSNEILPWVGTYFAGDSGRFKVGPSLFRMQSDVPGITLSPDNDDQLHRLGLSVGWDTRDSWNLPRHGWLNEFLVWKTGGALGGDGDFWTVNFDLRRFQQLSERNTLVLASLLTVQPGEIPEYFRYYLGGANTVRGYSVEDSKTLSGKNQYLGTVEFRHILMPPHRFDFFDKWSFRFGLELAALGDIGIAWDTSNQFAANRLRGGVGIGLRLLHPGAGMTRFDFAWSPEGGFQFHFGGASKMARSRLRLR